MTTRRDWKLKTALMVGGRAAGGGQPSFRTTRWTGLRALSRLVVLVLAMFRGEPSWHVDGLAATSLPGVKASGAGEAATRWDTSVGSGHLTTSGSEQGGPGIAATPVLQGSSPFGGAAVGHAAEA
eukprot:CAMPEP_0198307392 /NCGR_PEP_ID=MMETSP1450-20131203/284_1 /TAXON_ID=753684 ORGANISM="Madagascaria erythrocladiodes, Strain CCMP3234" /NCGR_SAMPLE_ID=MMETSP1450 /ASSEMBLY_ACC=CAM_ASM_001115 /LENGTH=124 /DNA_ID=CAMNT_0044009971 /DNA_START=2186 /DNA_END=2559 /DNA_ORIENTATION=-